MEYLVRVLIHTKEQTVQILDSDWEKGIPGGPRF